MIDLKWFQTLQNSVSHDSVSHDTALRGTDKKGI